MTETQLILTAMSKEAPQRRKSKVMKEIEPDAVVPELDDIIWRNSRKKPRTQKIKSISQWNGKDFIRHIEKNLSQFGLTLESGMGGRDSSWILKLHDMLVPLMGDNMSNTVLREYVDWWVGSQARLQQGPIYIRSMMNERHIARFLKQYRGGHRMFEMPAPKTETVAVSDEELLALGGLNMLVMSRGIVNAYRALRKTDKNALMTLQKTMRTLSRDVVEQVMRTTLEFGPYQQVDAVDFVSVARPALKYHDIKDFNNVRYSNYFKEK